MKVCQIGLGNWGKNHARVWDELKREGEIDEIYFFDLNKDLQARTAKIFNGNEVVNLEDLDVDLIDIVVPADYHYQVAKPFLEKGMKIMMEKPITDDLIHAQELVDLCDDPMKQIMVGHIFRYHVGVSLAKELVDKGAIGEILKIDIRRIAYRKPREDNGVVLSLGIHDLDLFSYFNKEKDPISISAITSKVMGPTEDHAFIRMNFDENVAIAEESWMAPTSGKIRTCEIQGTDGEIKFNFSEPGKVSVHSKYINERDELVDNGEFIHQTLFKEPLKYELSDFVKRSKSNEDFLTNYKVGIRALKMCLMALESGNTGKEINYSDFQL